MSVVERTVGPYRRLFAMKRPLERDRLGGEARRMFLEEARVAGAIRHANVVGVVDAGEDEDGPYIVMELVDGISITELLVLSPEPLPVQIVARIARDVARGLHAAHQQRGPDGGELHLVHRDVSPGNILLGFDGVCRLTDFGIARAIGRSFRTETGILKGKLGYMAPEVLRFEGEDRRADLFALGVLTWELLSGERLYPVGRRGVSNRCLTGRAQQERDSVGSRQN